MSKHRIKLQIIICVPEQVSINAYCVNAISYKSLLPKLANDGALGSMTEGLLTGTTWFWMGDGGVGTVVDGNEIGAGGNARARAVPTFSFS